MSPGTTPRPALFAALGLTLIGLAVSTYLGYEHATGTTTLACPETGVVNCQKVTTSPYSVVFGIPVAYLGLAFFLAVLGIVAIELRRPTAVWGRVRLAATVVGTVAVAYLVWAEFVGVRAICLWCTGVHVVTFLLFVLSVFTEALRLPSEPEA